MSLVWDSSRNETSPLVAEGYRRFVCERAADMRDVPVEEVTVYRMYQYSPLDGEYEEPSRSVATESVCPIE